MNACEGYFTKLSQTLGWSMPDMEKHKHKHGLQVCAFFMYGVCHSFCDILDIILRLLKSSNCFILQLQQKASDNFLTPDKILSSVFSFHKGESGK